MDSHSKLEHTFLCDFSILQVIAPITML